MENKEIQVKGFVVQPRLNFQNKRDKMLYQLLVDEANYVSNTNCEVGQVIISVNQLSEEIGWSRGLIRGSLMRLKEAGYITFETLPQKRGILVTITNYDEFQSLKTYKSSQEKNQGKTKDEPTESQEKNQESEPEKPRNEGENACPKNSDNQENNQGKTKEEPRESQEDNQVINNITSFKQHINNNEHIKDLRGNFNDLKHVELFVDLAEQINPLGLNKKTLIKYFDTIRLTRQTCRISVNVCIGIWEKLKKLREKGTQADILHYALITHALNHDDKREEYTFGIIRNTTLSEARRKLIKIMNTNRTEEVFAYDRASPDGGKSDPDELDQLSL